MKRARYYFRHLLAIIVLSSILLMNSSLGQTGIPYCWGCTANDITISDLWLGDVNGNPLPPCSGGNPVTAYVWVKFSNNQNSQRNGILLYAKIKVDGNTIYDSFASGGECVLNNPGSACSVPPSRSCLAGSGSTGSTFDKMLVSFSYECGQEVILEDFYIGWEAGGTKCTDCVCPGTAYACQHSKCYHGQNIIVPGNQPLISIKKGADPIYVASGGLVTYTYRVSNTGNTNLLNVVITDDKGLIPIRGADIVGNGDNILNVGEIWQYSATSHPTADVTNIGTVTAQSPSGTQVSDQDDETVRIISLDITKTATPVLGCPEIPVTFTITLSSGFPITTVTITDILPLGLTYVSSNPPGTVDQNNPKKIDWTSDNPTLPWVITLGTYMDGAAFGQIVNPVTATGTIYENSVTKSASSTVNVLEDPEAIITQVSPPP
jgi:uncharacterized repeat protein (TIGR01451 family)